MAEYVGENIRVVFFDHDDTLVGTIGPKWKQHKYVARTFYDKDLTDDEIRLYWGRPLPELVCRLYGTDDVEHALANNYSCRDDYPKERFAAVNPTLRHLRADGKRIGVITATTRASFEQDLDSDGVPHELLDYTQTADDTDYHKPDPRVFGPATAWLAERKLEPRQVLYVGDGLHDMHAAVGAGFNFLGVETGLVTAEQFRAAGALSVPSVASLLPAQLAL
jgi:phosphoglycolate phosphatase-like HAD superfamily hydrolase